MASTIVRHINIKQIDHSTKYLANGFVRDIQKKIENIIPDGIIVVILSFYYFPEYFKDFNCDYHAIIDTEDDIENQRIKCIEGMHQASIYGNIQISLVTNRNMSYSWTFKVNRCIYNHIYFGISSTNNINERFYENTNSSNYCICLDGYKITKDHAERYTNESFHSGDIISMIIDCQSRQLSFKKNGKNLGIAYDNIDHHVTYKMAIAVKFEGDEVELIDFECCSYG